MKLFQKFYQRILSQVSGFTNKEAFVENMDNTVKLIHRYITRGYSPKNRIVNTGIIVYHPTNDVLELFNRVYNACIKLKQPECQIFWAIFSQDYESIISKIDGVNR